MKCHVCGSTLKRVVTDLPFKLDDTKILIVKSLPVLVCPSCGEYLLEGPVMSHVDAIIARVDESAELEIVTYAA